MLGLGIGNLPTSFSFSIELPMRDMRTERSMDAAVMQNGYYQNQQDNQSNSGGFFMVSIVLILFVNSLVSVAAVVRFSATSQTKPETIQTRKLLRTALLQECGAKKMQVKRRF
jgi:hypothetical protein